MPSNSLKTEFFTLNRLHEEYVLFLLKYKYLNYSVLKSNELLISHDSLVTRVYLNFIFLKPFLAFWGSSMYAVLWNVSCEFSALKRSLIQVIIRVGEFVWTSFLIYLCTSTAFSNIQSHFTINIRFSNLGLVFILNVLNVNFQKK